MVLLTEFKNRVRDLIDADKYQGQLGTGTTTPTEDDTALETPVAATLSDLTSTVSDKQLVLDYTLNSSTGNGNAFAEYECQFNAGSTNGNRVIFSALTKVSGEEWQISTIIRII